MELRIAAGEEVIAPLRLCIRRLEVRSRTLEEPIAHVESRSAELEVSIAALEGFIARPLSLSAALRIPFAGKRIQGVAMEIRSPGMQRRSTAPGICRPHLEPLIAALEISSRGLEAASGGIRASCREPDVLMAALEVPVAALQRLIAEPNPC